MKNGKMRPLFREGCLRSRHCRCLWPILRYPGALGYEIEAWDGGDISSLSQPYQGLAQSESFWFVVLGVAFLLIAVMRLTCSTAALAATEEKKEVELLEHVKSIAPQPGILTSGDGTKTEVSGNLVNVRMMDDDKITCTYAYDVALPRASGTATEDGTDQSISIKAYNTVVWETSTVQEYTSVSLPGCQVLGPTLIPKLS